MIDRRFTQTQHRFASDDLETMSEAHRYQAHIFDLFRAYIGKRVLEVGAGIGTMSRSLLTSRSSVVGIEPNQACATRALARARAITRASSFASVISKNATARRWSPSGSTRSRASTCSSYHRGRCQRAAIVRRHRGAVERPRAGVRAGRQAACWSARRGAGPPSALLEAFARHERSRMRGSNWRC